MLEKLYELWSTEEQVMITIEGVGVNCILYTHIEQIRENNGKVYLEFEDHVLGLSKSCECEIEEDEMTILFLERTGIRETHVVYTAVTINWSREF